MMPAPALPAQPSQTADAAKATTAGNRCLSRNGMLSCMVCTALFLQSFPGSSANDARAEMQLGHRRFLDYESSYKRAGQRLQAIYWGNPEKFVAWGRRRGSYGARYVLCEIGLSQ
jgi:hypothetical protein